MNDLKGRAYATKDQVKEGTKIQADGDFDCIRKNAILPVQEDKDGLFISCKDGHHYLDGQLSDDGSHYVGLYHVG